MTFKAVNWNKLDSNIVLDFWQAGLRQFWIDTEIPVSDDRMAWANLSSTEKETYKRVLGGLTLLDTVQGTVGMPKILEHVESQQEKSVLSLFGFMETIHAKSYSTIFTTLASTQEIDEVFDWVKGNKYLQKKAKIVHGYYMSIGHKYDLYMAMVASTFLESFLFYSGFFYPLYLAGQGKMTASGEIINLIIRDEAIHGVFVGQLAQELKKTLSKKDQELVEDELYELLDKLYRNEVSYTDELYGPIGLAEEVKTFVRYNANKALQNLGYDPHFPEENINPIVLNGLKTDTKHFDFFSLKGNGYVKALNVQPLTDDDFHFE